MFTDEESPPPGLAFSEMPTENIVAFLRDWRPEPEANRHTVTALAQELRSAVSLDPTKFAAAAERFTCLKSIYVRSLLDALQQEAANQKFSNWDGVLSLVEFVYRQGDRAIGPATICPGDDTSWDWARKSASALLVTGLQLGGRGIPTGHTATVRSLVATALAGTQNTIDVDGFDERFSRHPYLTAHETSRGIAVELCILFARWTNPAPPVGNSAPLTAFSALPDLAQFLELQLADRSPSGQVPRAIVGRYLRVLYHIDPAWLKTQMPNLLPADSAELRRAGWRAHIESDGGPVSVLLPELHACYVDEITRLSEKAEADTNDDRRFRQERFATYVMVLVIRGIIPESLLAQFERQAPASIRHRAMWFLGNQVSLPLSEVPEDARARGLAYWERRLTAAKAASQPNEYREELRAISYWCFLGVVDEWWLSDQLLALFKMGLAPHDGHGIVEWLEKLAVHYTDRAVESLLGLLRCPGVERWTYMTQHKSIRSVLSEGLARGTPKTHAHVRDTINHLASIGAPEFMDLEPPLPINEVQG